MRISDWSSDVCSSDLGEGPRQGRDDMRGKRLALAMMMACAGSAAIAAPLHAQAAPAETLEIDKKRIDAALAAMIADGRAAGTSALIRSEEHTSELQSLMRISYAGFCLKKQNTTTHNN